MHARLIYLLITLAFGAGLLYTLHQHPRAATSGPEQPTPAQQTSPTPPEIRTDAFTLRLLRAALHTTEGNILLAPHAIAENLRTLRDISQGPTHDELDRLGLGDSGAPGAEAAGEAAILFADNSLTYIGHTLPDNVISAPLGGTAGESLVLLNSLLADITGDTNAHFIHGDHLSGSPGLLSFCSLYLAPAWELPLLSAPAANADFFNANGSMPRIRTVQCSGNIRHAQAADGSWQAVALFLRLSPQSPTDECLLLILPRDTTARAFAAELTPELLNTIRTSLAQTAPEPRCVEWPRLTFSPPTQDLSPLLRELGLRSLFSPAADLSRLATDKPFYLHAALQKCRIPMVETSPAAPTDIAALSFDKPFIWLIGSLSSPAPPFALGIVENL